MINDQELIVAEDEEVEAEQSLQDLESKRDGEADLESEEPLAEVRYLDVVTVLEQILEGKAVDETKLAALADAERDALLFFRQVVDGRTSSNEFMYAERRLEGLNRVLAALQPALSVGGAHQVLHESLLDVIDGIEELRQKLVGLEDAQDDEFGERVEQATAGEADVDDKPTPDAKPGDKPKPTDKAKTTDDDLDAENRIRKAAAKPGARAPAEADVDDGKPNKSDVWDPDAPDVPEPTPQVRRSTLE